MAKLLKETEYNNNSNNNRTHPIHASNRLALDLTHGNPHTIMQPEECCTGESACVTERDRSAGRPSAPPEEDIRNLPPVPSQPQPFQATSTFRQPHFWGSDYQRQPSITQL